MIALLQQTFAAHDLVVILFLIILEGVLSIDNALVLGILARRLPKEEQKKALTYGLVGALVFRLIAVGLASYLLHWHFVKLIGGAYLIYIAVKHFFFESGDGQSTMKVDEHGSPKLVNSKTGEEMSPEQEAESQGKKGGSSFGLGKNRSFWATVFVIEMTDIAFAVDSIVAALGFVGANPEDKGRHPKLWVVMTGGMIGVVVMRFAAVLFIKLLEKFPRFETAAYLLVIVIGAKLVSEWAEPKLFSYHLDYHDPKHVEFWVFWVLMIASFCVGFLPKKSAASQNDA